MDSEADVFRAVVAENFVLLPDMINYPRPYIYIYIYIYVLKNRQARDPTGVINSRKVPPRPFQPSIFDDSFEDRPLFRPVLPALPAFPTFIF